MSLFFLDSDSRILDLIRKGDEEALVELYNGNRKAITSFITMNSGTAEDAEDMLQEAILIVWERVRSGRYVHSAKLSTFLYAVVKNMWARNLARKRREIPLSLDPDMTPADEISVMEELIQSEQAQTIRAALEKLGDPCRKLLMLFYWEEMSLEAIAREMGFANADTVKSKKYQCKEMLKKLLKALS